MRVGNTVVPYHRFSSDSVFKAKFKALSALQSSMLWLSAVYFPLTEWSSYKAI